MKLARGQARSVIPPTAPMCRKGPVAWGGKGRALASISPASLPKSTCSSAGDLLLQPALLEGREGQGEKGREGQAGSWGDQTYSLPCPLIAHHSDCSCSREDCKSRSTLPGQAAEAKDRELTSMAHSHAGVSSHHPSAHSHRPGSGHSGGVSGMEVTHLQGDTCTSPLLCPLYSQPCEGCSHHQGNEDQQGL